MTVLSRYQRLECAGVWQESAEAQRRNVYVALGEASLVITDGAGTALAHWSLPAVERRNPGTLPALYSPGGASDEVLELDDEEMIEAIRTVRRSLARAGPHPGRLRQAVLWASLAGAVALAVFWLPGALTRHAAATVPDTVRAEIGQSRLQALVPYTGRACTNARARPALDRLRDAVLEEPGWNVVVVPGGPRLSAHLPGRLILARRDLVARADGPAALAGALVAEAARARAHDPLAALLDWAGPGASLRLLVRGALPEATIAAYAGEVLVRPRPPLPQGRLAAAFAAAGISPGPYLALARRPRPDIAAAGTTPGRAPLAETGWLRLQGICEG